MTQQTMHPTDVYDYFRGETGPARTIIWAARLALAKAEESGKPWDHHFLEGQESFEEDPVELLVQAAEQVIRAGMKATRAAEGWVEAMREHEDSEIPRYLFGEAGVEVEGKRGGHPPRFPSAAVEEVARG